MEHKNLCRVGVFICIFAIFMATIGYAQNISGIATPKSASCNPELDDECGGYTIPSAPTKNSTRYLHNPCTDPYHDEECYVKPVVPRVRGAGVVRTEAQEETVRLESYMEIFACLLNAQSEDDCVPFELAHTLEGAKKYQVMDTKVKYGVMQTHYCFNPNDPDTYGAPTLDTTCNLGPWATSCLSYSGLTNFCVSEEGETFECSPVDNPLLHIWVVIYEYKLVDGVKKMVVLSEFHIGRIYRQSDYTDVCYFVIKQDGGGAICDSTCDGDWGRLLRGVFTRPAYAPWLSPDKVSQMVVHYNVEFSKVALVVEGLGFMEIMEAVATGAAIGVYTTLLVKACMVTGGTACSLIRLPAPI
jgi:hypothetical protein